MILTPLHTIRGRGTILISPIKPQILHLTIFPKVIQTLRVSNTVLLPNINLHHPSTKIQLESLMERFIQTQTKTNETLGESVSQLNSKFESLSTHQKMMET